MKNNEYKKYYDKVSPDQKLVDETKIKMLEELAKTQRENITFWTASRRYIAAAACFVLIGATIAIVPNLQKIPVAENNINKNAVTTTVTSIKPDDEALPVTSVTTQKEDKIVSEKVTTVTSDTRQDITALTGITLQTTVSSKQSDTNSQSVRETTVYSENTTQSEVNTQPTQTDKPDTPAVTQPPVTTQKPEISSFSEPIVTDVPDVPQTTTGVLATTPAVTTTKIFKPGGATTDITTQAVSQSSSDITGEKNFYTKEISGIGEVCVNLSYDYESVLFSNVSLVTRDDAAEFFDAIPTKLVDENVEIIGIAEQYDNTFKNGISFDLSDEHGRNAFISIGKGTFAHRYKVYCKSPEITVIDGCDYNITEITKYDDVFICTFSKDNMYYNFKFEGYTIEEIFDILLS